MCFTKEMTDFFVEYIDNKSIEDVLETIYKFNFKILRLKEIVEQRDFCADQSLNLKEIDEIKYLRNCIYFAISWLKEKGVEYDYSVKQINAIKFNEKLRNIKSLSFYRGGCFSGYTTYSFSFNENTVSCIVSNRDGVIKSKDTLNIDKEQYIKLLEGLYMGEWENQYVNRDIYDGLQWGLTIYFIDEEEPFNVNASNAGPYNFSEAEKYFTID